jgi:acetyl-CoA acetyltransferase
MSLRHVAVVGFALEPLVAHDEHRTAQELLYSAVRRALADAGIERDAIDLQLAGSADYVDGKPFGFVQSLDVTGSWPPRQDSHLEMDAAFAAYYGWLRLQAEECDTVMVVGYGKNSEGDLDRVSNIRLDPYYQAAIGLETTSTSALQASAYMARSGATDRDLAEVVAANRARGVANPEALLREPVSADELAATPWAVEPLRKGYLAPKADTAVCLLLAAEGKADKADKIEKMCAHPAWIHGVDQRAEMQSLGARDLSRSASAEMATSRALGMSGIASARDVDLIELSAATPAEEMILREAMRLDRRGETGPAINPSGGPLCGHPFMMTGLIRLGEVFRRIGGGAERGIAHATQGHCLQQNLSFVLAAERRKT